MEKFRKQALVIEYIPVLVMFLVFYFLPVVQSWKYLSYGSTGEGGSWILNGYYTLCETFDNQYYRLGLKNIIEIAGIQTSLVMISGFVLAILLWLSKYPYRYFTWMIIPAFIPSAAMAFLWTRFQHSAHDTMLFYVLSSSGVSIERVMLITLFLWKQGGLVILIIWGAIQQQPDSSIEAMRLDGAGIFQICRYMIIPGTKPVLCGIAIYELAMSLRLFRESWLLYGNYPDQSVYTVMNYLNNHFQKIDYASVAAGSVILTTILAAAAVFGFFVWKALRWGSSWQGK